MFRNILKTKRGKAFALLGAGVAAFTFSKMYSGAKNWYSNLKHIQQLDSEYIGNFNIVSRNIKKAAKKISIIANGSQSEYSPLPEDKHIENFPSWDSFSKRRHVKNSIEQILAKHDLVVTGSKYSSKVHFAVPKDGQYDVAALFDYGRFTFIQESDAESFMFSDTSSADGFFRFDNSHEKFIYFSPETGKQEYTPSNTDLDDFNTQQARNKCTGLLKFISGHVQGLDSDLDALHQDLLVEYKNHMDFLCQIVENNLNANTSFMNGDQFENYTSISKFDGELISDQKSGIVINFGDSWNPLRLKIEQGNEMLIVKYDADADNPMQEKENPEIVEFNHCVKGENVDFLFTYEPVNNVPVLGFGKNIELLEMRIHDKRTGDIYSIEIHEDGLFQNINFLGYGSSKKINEFFQAVLEAEEDKLGEFLKVAELAYRTDGLLEKYCKLSPIVENQKKVMYFNQ